MKKLALVLALLFCLAPATALAKRDGGSVRRKPVAPVVELPTASEAMFTQEAEEAPDAGPVPDVSEDGIQTEEEAFEKGLEVAGAVANKAWWVVFGFLLMLTTFFARKFNWLKKVPSEYMPWVTVGIGAVASIGEALYAGHSMAEAIANTGTMGTTAVFLWEGGFKHMKAFKGAKATATKPGKK